MSAFASLADVLKPKTFAGWRGSLCRASQRGPDRVAERQGLRTRGNALDDRGSDGVLCLRPCLCAIDDATSMERAKSGWHCKARVVRLLILHSVLPGVR